MHRHQTTPKASKKSGEKKSNCRKKDIEVVATLDLHYKTKAMAIASLTSFLSETVRKYGTEKDQKGIWVRIITGTGHHSKQGPILRLAVQKILKKREMSHVLNEGKGSFTVRADSGYELIAHDPSRMVDSKLLIVSEQKDNAGFQSCSPHKTYSSTFSRTKESISSSSNALASARNKEYFPQPIETLNYDETLNHVKRISGRQNKDRMKKKEEKELTDAIRSSNVTYNLEKTTLDHEFSILEQAIEASISDLKNTQEQETELIKSAVASSLEHEKKIDEQERNRIDQAIAFSLSTLDEYYHQEDDFHDQLNSVLKLRLNEI